MKELSVFIDESGDFGEVTERLAYYLVTGLLKVAWNCDLEKWEKS